MKNDPHRHIETLKRRLAHLQQPEYHRTSWALQEMGALGWALANLEPMVEKNVTLAHNVKFYTETPKLREALIAAKEHLEYTGYGDSWERECALSQGLAKQIDEALNEENQTS